MNRLKRVGPEVPEVSAEVLTTRGRRAAYPEDLLRQASSRLVVMAWLGAALWFIGTVLGHVAYRLMTQGAEPWLEMRGPDWIAVVNILVSLGLVGYARRSDGEPWHILDLGLWYLGFTSLSLGLMAHWDPPPPGWLLTPQISWIGALVLIFAAIVPNPPRKMLWVGLVAAVMNPLGMVLANIREIWDPRPISTAFLMHYPDFILVGVSVLISKVVTGLGQQVVRARELGSYELGELLGKGGMGEVYRATHRMLARPAAIKLIRPERLGAGEDAELVVRRFHREAETAASLRSPHTVELYDFGVTADRTLYLVMEMLDGMDLEELVRRTGPVPAGRAIHILRQACESLEEAHVRGLVHRDIKPPNIHLGRLGLSHDFVKVLDFGLVKSVKEDAVASMGTAAGLTPGTPAYMAPELVLGEPYDGRADLYALGCVAYFLLTGQLVFEGASGMQMIARHVSEQPVPPSRRSELVIPSDLEQIVMTCLAKNPDARPASAAQLSARLLAVPAEPWGEAEAAQWWRNYRPA